MKKISISILVLATMLLTVPDFVQASPYYITLSGVVTQSGGTLAKNISAGSKVNYVIKIDTATTGYTGSGSNKVKVPMSYYVSLYSGALSGAAHGENVQDVHYINHRDGGFEAYASNKKSDIYINDWTDTFKNLVKGSTIEQLYENAYEDDPARGINKQYSQIISNNLVVTNISTTAPTPIPGAAIIFLGGLGVVGFMKRKFKFRQGA